MEKHMKSEHKYEWIENVVMTRPEYDRNIEQAKSEAIAAYIKPHLDACESQNGIRRCKNCGLEDL